jgi:6-pyruvoyltetrahydropterin/6-carboxytetrahydropterin synthase
MQSPPRIRGVRLTRVASFSAAHRYENPALSPEENARLFGKCNFPWGHGHDYRLEVTLGGEVSEKTGMIVPLEEVDRALAEVLRAVDHRHLNHEVPFFRDRIPTTENIAVYLWGELARRLPEGALVRIRLHEDERLFVEYSGETPGT